MVGRFLIALVLLTTSFVSASPQSYPSRPITVVVGVPAGSVTDVFTRVLAERMKSTLGQSLIVENITGAGGTIGTARAARAAPDGYTLSVGNVGTHVVSPATYPNIQYHPLNDFEPIAIFVTSPYWLVAKKALPPKDLTELITWLKANPDKASVAMVGTGGIDQIVGTHFQQQIGTRFQFVPYRGGGPAIQDLVAGHVDLRFDAVGTAVAQVRSGQIKAYAVMGKTRASAAPRFLQPTNWACRRYTLPSGSGCGLPRARQSRSLRASTPLWPKRLAIRPYGSGSLSWEPKFQRASSRRLKRLPPSTRLRSTNGGRLSNRLASRRNDFVARSLSAKCLVCIGHADGSRPSSSS